MKSIIYEYASTGIAILASLGFLGIVEQMFLGQEGFIALFVSAVIGGV